MISVVLIVATAAYFTTSSALGSRAASSASEASPLEVYDRGTRAEQCHGARKGLRWYRGWYHHWTAKMSRPAFDTVIRVTSRCPIYLAKLFRSKARTAHARYVKWLKSQASWHPRRIAAYLLRNDPGAYECLMYIVNHENARMDPTLDFGGGHGDTSEAYGIPQANPGYKMASHGPDWRTNPWTQLRWMIDYCRNRYGSVCGAADHRRYQGMY